MDQLLASGNNMGRCSSWIEPTDAHRDHDGQLLAFCHATSYVTTTTQGFACSQP